LTLLGLKFIGFPNLSDETPLPVSSATSFFYEFPLLPLLKNFSLTGNLTLINSALSRAHRRRLKSMAAVDGFKA